MSEKLRQLLDRARRLSYRQESDPSFSWRDAFYELVDEIRALEHQAARAPGRARRGTVMSVPEYVYVARCAEVFGDTEVYVFDTQENADAFVETRASEWTVTEEPILDTEFVSHAREGSV